MDAVAERMNHNPLSVTNKLFFSCIKTGDMLESNLINMRKDKNLAAPGGPNASSRRFQDQKPILCGRL
jgi:hypothetical protein